MGSKKRASKLPEKKPNKLTRKAMRDAEAGRTIKGLPFKTKKAKGDR